MALPWAVVARRLVRRPAQLQHRCSTVNLNAVDFGAAFLPQNQDPTLAPSATPGATAVATDLMRAVRGYSTITQTSGWLLADVPLAPAVASSAGSGTACRSGSTTRSASPISQNVAPRLQHAADGIVYRPARSGAKPTSCSATTIPSAHIMKANFVWDLPDLQGAERRAAGRRLRRQRLAAVGHLDGRHRRRLHGRLQLPERRRQREPHRLARLRRAHPRRGRSRRRLQQRRLPAVQHGGVPGPAGRTASVSNRATATCSGCFSERARSGDRSATSGSAAAGRSSCASTCSTPRTRRSSPAATRRCSLTSPTDPVTPQNLPFDASGHLIATRSLPKNAGFGVANNYQAPRSVQVQIRFRF